MWVSEMGEQGRDPRRVFPAGCQAGRKDITLAELIALRGMEVSNRNPESHCLGRWMGEESWRQVPDASVFRR